MGILDWFRGGQDAPADERPAEGAANAPDDAAEEPVSAAKKPASAAKKAAARKAPQPEAQAAEALMCYVEDAVDAVARIEAAVQPLVGMLQATAKSAAKSDQDRRQQMVDLRAHLTGETDRLADTLRERITAESATELWRAILPGLDEIDHVLREAALCDARGVESVRMVRRKLRDALSRLGIEEMTVEERATQFDAHLHEGKPHDGDDEAGLAAGTVTRVERAGYTLGDKVLRCALVTVVKG